jgi:hypothetical protein
LLRAVKELKWRTSTAALSNCAPLSAWDSSILSPGFVKYCRPLAMTSAWHDTLR